MKNIIYLDLTKFNNEKLKSVCESLKMTDPQVGMILDNKKVGIVKLYLNKDLLHLDAFSLPIIAYTTKLDKTIRYHDSFTEMLSKIDPIEAKKKVKLELTSVDSILDKISRFGIESITESEKNILDNQ
jgi:hypothetical protein